MISIAVCVASWQTNCRVVCLVTVQALVRGTNRFKWNSHRVLLGQKPTQTGIDNLGGVAHMSNTKKNHKGKIIVLYDEDEQIAPRAATIMTERGYNNIFLLSGGAHLDEDGGYQELLSSTSKMQSVRTSLTGKGLNYQLSLKYAVRKYPCGLITGTCPLAWTLSEATNRPARVHNCVQPSDVSHDEGSAAHTVTRSTKALRNATVTFDTREQFTAHDIEELNEQYEAHLVPKDTGARLSRARTDASKQSSRISNMSNRSNLSSISEKPWKP